MQVGKDPVDDLRFLDDGDNLHGCATAGAAQGVHCIMPYLSVTCRTNLSARIAEIFRTAVRTTVEAPTSTLPPPAGPGGGGGPGRARGEGGLFGLPF